MAEPTQTPLAPTPGQTIGPFYGYALPYERDHELVPPTHPDAIVLHGTVFDGAGTPVPDAMLEIRQTDPDGRVPRVEGSIRRDGTTFTGFGRAAVDPSGRYRFVTLTPAPADHGGAAFFAVTVFARGLLNRLFTRAYLPQVQPDADRLLASLDEAERTSLITVPDPHDVRRLRFDVHLQGAQQTTFLRYPEHED